MLPSFRQDSCGIKELYGKKMNKYRHVHEMFERSGAMQAEKDNLQQEWV